MPTRHLRLRKCRDGYFRTSWTDSKQKRYGRSFGCERAIAENEFAEFSARWKADPLVRCPSGEGPIKVRRGVELFLEHADQHYRHPDGTPTGEADNFRNAVVQLLDLYGEWDAADFGPKALMTVRDAMVALVDKEGERVLCINVINQRVCKIRHIWKWLAANELIPASTWHALLTVAGLSPGRTKARITEPVKPAPDAHVWMVVNAAAGPVAAMIQTQYYSALRPGEVCRLSPIDVDVSGKVWTYRPDRHKTMHRGKKRVAPLGPKCQEILRPYLNRAVAAPCFSPLETIREIYEGKRTHRRVPVEAPATERRVGNAYTPKAYALAIRRICEKLEIPVWSPNQLRHNALSRLRKEFGLDVAQVIAGHSSANVTEIYAELDMAKAILAMEKVG